MSEETTILVGASTRVDYENVTPYDIRLVDIASSLSNLCRYVGRLDDGTFLSVAEHSINVSEVLRRRGRSRVEQAVGLMHDATEAYIGDIPSPLKAYLGDNILELEGRIWRNIANRFRLPRVIPKCVRDVDIEIRAAEEFWCRSTFRPGEYYEPDIPRPSMGFTPRNTRNKFLECAERLEVY